MPNAKELEPVRLIEDGATGTRFLIYDTEKRRSGGTALR